MYHLNNLSLQLAQQLFIEAGRFRTGVQLVGFIDGSNQTYTTPGNEKFTQNLPFFTPAIYYNGQRLVLIDDYIVVESFGAGTGFDTIVMGFAPKPGDKIIADYIVV